MLTAVVVLVPVLASVCALAAVAVFVSALAPSAMDGAWVWAAGSVPWHPRWDGWGGGQQAGGEGGGSPRSALLGWAGRSTPQAPAKPVRRAVVVAAVSVARRR